MTMDEVSSIKIGADDRKKKHYKFSGNFELNVKMTQKTHLSTLYCISQII